VVVGGGEGVHDGELEGAMLGEEVGTADGERVGIAVGAADVGVGDGW